MMASSRANFFSIMRAAHLLRGGQFAVVVVEFLFQDGEAADVLDAGEALVGLVDDAIDQVMHFGQLRQRLVIGVGQGLVARPAADIVEIDLDDGAEVLLGLADHDRFLDELAVLQRVLDLGGRDVLAAGGDDDRLLAVDHGDLAIVQDLDDVAGAQPAAGIERGGGGLFVEEIALEDAGIAQQDFAVAVELPFGVEQGQAAAAEPVMALGLDEGDAAAFGQAIALGYRAADDVEEAQRLRRNRRAGAEAVTAAGEARDGAGCCGTARRRAVRKPSRSSQVSVPGSAAGPTVCGPRRSRLSTKRCRSRPLSPSLNRKFCCSFS